MRPLCKSLEPALGFRVQRLRPFELVTGEVELKPTFQSLPANREVGFQAHGQHIPALARLSMWPQRSLQAWNVSLEEV